MHNISQNIEIRRVGAAVTAASNTDSNSSRIDMTGYQAVCFVTTITDSVATGVATLKIETNSADSDSGMTAVTGSDMAATCAINDDINDTFLRSELVMPTSRYVQAVRTSATANIAFGEVYALLIPNAAPPAAHASQQGAGKLVING